MKETRPIPSEGQWFIRQNKSSGTAARYAATPTDTVRVGSVDHDRKEFDVYRVDGFTASGEAIVGRRSKIRFSTWADEATRHYTPIDDPTPKPPAPLDPVPEPVAEDIDTDGAEDRRHGGGQRPIHDTGVMTVPFAVRITTEDHELIEQLVTAAKTEASRAGLDVDITKATIVRRMIRDTARRHGLLPSAAVAAPPAPADVNAEIAALRKQFDELTARVARQSGANAAVGPLFGRTR